MGLAGSGGLQRPEDAHYPTGTPDELRQMGKDLSEVHSCAVPVSDGRGGTSLRGCPFAGKNGRCLAMFSGRNPRIGDFGPKSDVPGTAGEGPENVPFSIRTVEGDELESYMPCHRFLASVYPRMLAARDPRRPSGEKIRILGRAGQAKVVVTLSLPQEPKLCNKNGNNTMIHSTDVITVPKHIRPFDLDPTWKARQAAEAMDAEEDLAGVIGRGGDHPYGIDAASDEPEDVPAPVPAAAAPEPQAAVAEEAPVRRRAPRGA